MMFGFFNNFFGNDAGVDDASGLTYYEQIPDGHNGFGSTPDHCVGTGMDSWDSATNVNFWQGDNF
jgi:hypothetical protein